VHSSCTPSPRPCPCTAGSRRRTRCTHQTSRTAAARTLLYPCNGRSARAHGQAPPARRVHRPHNTHTRPKQPVDSCAPERPHTANSKLRTAPAASKSRARACNSRTMTRENARGVLAPQTRHPRARHATTTAIGVLVALPKQKQAAQTEATVPVQTSNRVECCRAALRCHHHTRGRLAHRRTRLTALARRRPGQNSGSSSASLAWSAHLYKSYRAEMAFVITIWCC
jgi:hypothetical protein